MMTSESITCNLTVSGKKDLITSYIDELSENLCLIELAIQSVNALDNSDPEAHKEISRIRVLLASFISIHDSTLDDLDNHLTRLS